MDEHYKQVLHTLLKRFVYLDWFCGTLALLARDGEIQQYAKIWKYDASRMVDVAHDILKETRRSPHHLVF